MSSAESTQLLHAVILGTDALLAARPATPIQLARACLRAGFDFVAPVSWGEELLASNVIESVRRTNAPASLIVHCPFVAEALRVAHSAVPACWRSVAPPVATARYLRAAFQPRSLEVTYAGRCPGASAPDIDACVLPGVLFARLLEGGVAPELQPRYFEELLPPDRARYASLPGGVPEPSALREATGARLHEAAAATLGTVALSFESTGPMVIDLEAASGCVCAQDRFAVTLLEPPRSLVPVVTAGIAVDLTDSRARRNSERPAFPTMAKQEVAVAVKEVSGPRRAAHASSGYVTPALTAGARTRPRAPALSSEPVPPPREPMPQPAAAAAEIPVQQADLGLTTVVEPWVPPPRAKTPRATVAESSVTPPIVDRETRIPVETEGPPAPSPAVRAQSTGTLNDLAPPVEAPSQKVEPAALDDLGGQVAEAPPDDARLARAPGAAVSQSRGAAAYPPPREALDELARHELRARRDRRLRRAGIVSAVGGLAVAVSVFATSIFRGLLSPSSDQYPTDPPRLAPLEITQPALDASSVPADSLRTEDTPAAMTSPRPDTGAHRRQKDSSPRIGG